MEKYLFVSELSVRPFLLFFFRFLFLGVKLFEFLGHLDLAAVLGWKEQ